MQLQIDKLGKVSITIEEGYWDINKDYDKLTVVEKQGTYGTFISRKPVPAGTVLTNREYWIPFSSLKEEIIIDYNKFINKYQPIIDDIVNRLNEGRLSKNIILVTYEELKTKRDEGSLIPGLWYQITDYKASTTDDFTDVNEGQFDILVLATSENTLSEEAKAVRHEGDTYYPDYVQFNAWKLWYCLDNDSNRFYWADEENGTGVIYRMIDEWNNDCPYDFKSIIFYHKDIGGSLTFSRGNADDIENMFYDTSTFLYNGEILAKNNKITPYITQIEEDYKERTVQVLNFISLLAYTDSNTNYCEGIVQNNILENCYDCFILGCADNKIINSSLHFSVNCMGNYIIRSTLNFSEGFLWAEADDISLQYNTISNSNIEVSRTSLAKGERWPEAIENSNIKNTEIYASYINILKSNILHSTLPKSGTMMPIQILYSYVNDLVIDDYIDNVPLVEIEDSVLNHNSLFIDTEPDIRIISSNLTNNSDLYIKDIENCSIRNTNCIYDVSGLTFENCSIHEVYNLEIGKEESTLPIKYVELKNIGEQIEFILIDESSNYHVIHENKRDNTLIADNL